MISISNYNFVIWKPLVLSYLRNEGVHSCRSNTVWIQYLNISGMEEYIAADPIQFEHHTLFTKLQTLSLEWRLNDPFASLVSNYISYLNFYFDVLKIWKEYIILETRSMNENCIYILTIHWRFDYIFLIKVSRDL